MQARLEKKKQFGIQMAVASMYKDKGKKVKLRDGKIVNTLQYNCGSKPAQSAELAAVISVLMEGKGSHCKLTIFLNSDWVFRGAVLMVAWWAQIRPLLKKRSDSVLCGKCGTILPSSLIA